MPVVAVLGQKCFTNAAVPAAYGHCGSEFIREGRYIRYIFIVHRAVSRMNSLPQGERRLIAIQKRHVGKRDCYRDMRQLIHCGVG